MPLRVCHRRATDERQRLAAARAELGQTGKVRDPVHLIRESRFLQQYEIGRSRADRRGNCAFATSTSVLDVVREETHD